MAEEIKYVSQETLDYTIEKLSKVLGAGDNSEIISRLENLESTIQDINDTLTNLADGQMFEGVKALTVAELANSQIDKNNHIGTEPIGPKDSYVAIYEVHSDEYTEYLLAFSNDPIAEDHLFENSMYYDPALPKEIHRIPKEGFNSQTLPWDKYKEKILETIVIGDKFVAPMDISYWFYNMTGFGISAATGEDANDFDKWDTKYVTNMDYLFCNISMIPCSEALSNWDVSSVVSAAHMFQGIRNDCDDGLIGLKNWNFKVLENIDQMFYDYEWLETAENFADWNVSTVTNAKHIFGETGIKDFRPLEKWSVSNFDRGETSLKSYVFGYVGSNVLLPSWATS